jgi:hypothetical protein
MFKIAVVLMTFRKQRPTAANIIGTENKYSMNKQIFCMYSTQGSTPSIHK